MPQQIESSTSSFCSAQELFHFIDPRQIADLLRDDDEATKPTVSNMTDSGNAYGAKLLALLRSGSGEVESACLPRGQYSVADLEAIAASSTNAGHYLKRITAGCTILAAFGRRHSASGSKPEDYVAVLQAHEALERLRVGERVFGLAGNISAGTGTKAIEFVNQSEHASRVVNEARRFFGNRTRGYE